MAPRFHAELRRGRPRNAGWARGGTVIAAKGAGDMLGTIRHKNMHPRRPANLLDRCLLAVAGIALVVLAGCPGRGSKESVSHRPDGGTSADAGLSCAPRVTECDAGAQCDWTKARASAANCVGLGYHHPFPARCGAYDALLANGGDQFSIAYYDPATGRLVGGAGSSFTGKDYCESFDPGFVLPSRSTICTPLVPQCPLCAVDAGAGVGFISCSSGDDAGTP